MSGASDRRDDRCFTFSSHFIVRQALDHPGIYANWGHRTEKPELPPTAYAGEHASPGPSTHEAELFPRDGAAIAELVVVQEEHGGRSTTGRN